MHTNCTPWNIPETKNRLASRIALGIMSILGLGLMPVLGDDDMEDWEKDAEMPNEVVIGFGGVFIDGDEAQFLQRESIGKDFYGGLEHLLYGTELSDDVSLELEARAMARMQDFLMRVRLEKEDLGFIEFGYESFREWYDATAGYYPPTDSYYSFFDEEMYVDRAKFWAMAHWKNDNGTSLDLKYTRREREGMKGSTRWADWTSPGGRYNMVPGFFVIDEARDTVEADLNHESSALSFNLGLVYDSNKQSNSRNHRRRPGESADRYVMQSENFYMETWNGHGSVSVQVNEKLRFNAGTSYTNMDTVLHGSRTINGEFDPVFDPTFQRQNRDHGFLNLDGQVDMTQWVLDANAEILASEHLQIVPSLRIESYDTDSLADVLESNSNGGTDSFEPLQSFGSNYWDDVSAQLDVVYRGLPNWVFTGTLYGAWGEGDIAERELDAELSEVLWDRASSRDRTEQKIEFGAKYYAKPGLHYSFNYYHKEGDNDWDNYLDPEEGNGYPSFYDDLDFSTDDVNFRIAWRPASAWNLSSRVDYQESKTENRGGELGKVTAAKMKTLIFSESVTFIPNDKWLFQGSFNIVSDKLETSADDLDGVNPMLVPDTTNDYWQADLSAQVTLNDYQSLLFRIFHYDSDGYVDSSGEGYLPYGYSDEQTSFTIKGTQKIDDATQVSLQYGFYDLNEMTSGGRNDYEAHVIYCRWERHF